MANKNEGLRTEVIAGVLVAIASVASIIGAVVAILIYLKP